MTAEKPTSLAGLSAVPELPVLRWEYRVFNTLESAWEKTSAEAAKTYQLSGYEVRALTLHAPAQSTIAAQGAEIERLKLERDGGKAYALNLATILWSQHFKAAAPNWEPLDDTLGLLTQIDNMVAGIATERDGAVAEAKEIRARWNDAENEFAALKATQVADAEETMRLADEYAEAERTQHNYSDKTRSDAAREALRAHITKDRT